MHDLTIGERQALAAILELAVREDLGKPGDLTSIATIPADLLGKAAFVARRAGILAGLPVCQRVLERIDPAIRLEMLQQDGARFEAGCWFATIAGPMRSILAAERVALNFLQHLSGIATQTRQYVDAVAGTNAKILDTRKTLPGWRLLEKYAVRMGGGVNHRIGLYDGILIKDNHLKSMRNAECGMRNEIEFAIQRCREANPSLPVEIEVESLEQLDQALICKPDIVLLDNMNLEMLREAVSRRDAVAPAVLLEASGGVNLDSVRGIAVTGIDRISVGALTHSAPALDIALDFIS
jgi:nicotinate-nucleotide pyrophosphorylase (carboxylating)